MGLLQADLQALGNLPTTAVGRRVITSIGLGLCLFALSSWWFAAAVFEQPQLLELLHGLSGGDSLRALIGHGLMPCPMAATWLGLALAQRQLFETPELQLWRSSPLPPWRGALQVLLRACFLTLCCALALAAPFVLALLQRSTAPPWAYALVPLAVLCCTAPLLCTLLAMQVILVRFLAGRLLRLVFMVIAALASVGFSTWLLLGLFTPGTTRMQELAETAAAPKLPWTIDMTSALLASAARNVLDTNALRAVLAWLGLTVAIFWFAARLHPRALEQHELAEPPVLRRGRRPWPASLAATVRKKEFAQLVQQPGALIQFVVFAVLVWVLAHERLLVAGILANRQLPAEVAHLGAMLAQWFLAVLLVLYAHMGRLALWDGAQWSLYMASPAAPGAILRGKLTAIAALLLWPLVLVAGAGEHLLEANRTTLLAFLGIGLGGTLAALGVLAVVGTWPRLMRPDDGGQILQGGRTFVAATVLVVLFEIAVSPAVVGWWWLCEYAKRSIPGLRLETALAWAPAVVAGAVLIGAAIAGLGTWIGARNYRRLLAPR
jgi:hypothetical protein